jgi:predicted aspartyl protease
VAGKRHGRGQLNAVVPGELLRVTDGNTGRRFLVDTGAAFSVLPHDSRHPAAGDRPKLSAVGGQNIECYGEKKAVVNFAGRDFEWTFLLAAVEMPLLGADFLKHYKLVVDLAGGCMVEAGTLTRIGDQLRSGGGGGELFSVLEDTPPAIRELLGRYPEVVNPSHKLPPVKHAVEHVIVTTGRPVTAKFRRLDAAKLAAAKAEFLQMERDSIIRRSSSPWASPLHMVLKKDGTWRPCGD